MSWGPIRPHLLKDGQKLHRSMHSLCSPHIPPLPLPLNHWCTSGCLAQSRCPILRGEETSEDQFHQELSVYPSTNLTTSMLLNFRAMNQIHGFQCFSETKFSGASTWPLGFAPQHTPPSTSFHPKPPDPYFPF